MSKHTIMHKFTQNKEYISAIVLLFVFASIHMTLRETSVRQAQLIPAPSDFLGLSIDTKIIKRLLGIRLVVADIVWIDTLLKVDASKAKEPYSKLYKATEVITTLDPENIFIYYIMGLYLSVVLDDIKGASAILKSGAFYAEKMSYVDPELLSKLHFILGYNLVFEEQNIEEGAKWIQKAAEYPGAPKHLHALAERVKTEKGRLELAARVLGDFYKKVDSEEEKKQVEGKMLQVALQQELLDLNERFDQFLSSTGAYALPRSRALGLFFRTLGHSKKSLLGKELGLNRLGKIDQIEK